MIAAWLLAAALAAAADPVAQSDAALSAAMRAAAAAPRAELVARERFLQSPRVGGVQLAPDGRHLSWIAVADGRTDVWLQDLASGERRRLLSDVRGVELAWSADGRRLWLADADGLAVADGESLQPRRILRWDPRRSPRFRGAPASTPAFALVHERSGPGARATHRYLRVDARGGTTLLHESAQPLRDALLDDRGELAAVAAYDGAGWDTAIRRFVAGEAQEVLRCTGGEECRLVGRDPRTGRLWILSQHGEDTLALQRWQPDDPRWRTVQRDAVADADGLLWDAPAGTWRAIAFRRAQRRWTGNGAAATAIAALQRRWPGASLDLAASADGGLWLVRADRSDWPLARHFLYRPAGDRLQRLFAGEEGADALPPAAAGVPMRPLAWRGRDGMLLHGYVLLPRGVAPARAPLVAWLHGGPIARVDDRYDPRLQLLANRGYAVFVPNFRHSSGYGRTYALAGQGDVGDGRVLADIVAGLDHLLAAGVGDRARQAVAGHSFGGYAALLAASHHPQRFAVAFAGAAPTDYGWIKQWQAAHAPSAGDADGPPLALQFRRFGMDPADAAWRAKMRRESPLAQLPALRARVVLWAGGRDERVPIRTLVHYAGEARRLGRDVALFVDPDAGHVPAGALGDEAWLYLFEAALHRQFAGGLTPPSPALAEFLRRNGRTAPAP